MKNIFWVILFFVSIEKNTAQTKDWKLGIQMWTFHISTFTDAVKRIDSCGLKYVEIYPGQKIESQSIDVIGSKLSIEKINSIKKLLKQYRITITSYGVVACEYTNEWESHFQFAQLLNIPIITAEPKKDDLDVVNTLAGKYHIKVAIHNHPKPSLYWHPDSILNAIKNRNNIFVCADIGHWVRNGLNVVDCLQKLNGRIIGLHFKDVAEYNKTESEDVHLGEGVCNIPEVLKELKKQQFHGYFAMEHEANWPNNVKDIIINKKYYLQKIEKLK
jgi:sugar phosphate isomerase/epimerase